ncbi:MAG: YceH family protein [Zoogloeaceae bacterium]|uniref:YceH family protein n=1 Tax=Denitromonas sp. TaxID=2734609 RepID=UPI001DA5E603|nr:YceH family protein [Rhodocyclaceae bacterium]MCP5221343.1 YceH family protein [Zoogloeaceae bacterium]HPR06417.1 YceH family protein [Denitromonas sp.]
MTDTTESTEGFDLSQNEARVLAVLIEKSFTTPDQYPLSINAITTGANQLTGREPVMQLDESEVSEAISQLLARGLIGRYEGARVVKYEHRIRLRHSLPPAEQAIMALLMLRGPQTAGELRSRSERMHRFEDIPTLQAALEHLAEKYPPMVLALPRAPGTKETRYAHLMCGEVDVASVMAATAHVAPGGLAARVDTLESEVAALRAELHQLKISLGEAD